MLKPKFAIFRHIVLTLSLVGLCACSSKTTSEKSDLIEFDTISTDAVIGIPLGLNIHGDTLQVNQARGDNYMQWINLKDGAVIKAALKQGNAPGEVLGLVFVQRMADNSFYIYDPNRFTLYKSDFAVSCLTPVANLPMEASKVFKLDNGETIFSKIPFGVDDEKVKNSRFAVITNDGKQIDFGEYPRLNSNEKDYTSDILANFHQIVGFCELSSNRFVVASSHVISLYEKNDSTYRLVAEKMIEPYDYTFKEASKYMSASTKPTSDTKRGLYTNLVSRNGVIYAPVIIDEAKGVEIRCYDENLNQLKTIHTNLTSDSPIAITDEGKIVAIGENEDSFILLSRQSLDE